MVLVLNNRAASPSWRKVGFAFILRHRESAAHLSRVEVKITPVEKFLGIGRVVVEVSNHSATAIILRGVHGPEQVAEKIRSYVDLGCTGFYPWCSDYPEHESLRLFAEKVIPSFR